MNPLKPQAVYVAVSVKDEMPPIGAMVDVSFDGGVTFPYQAKGKSWKPDEVVFSHWLKPLSEQYVFSKEELEKLLRDTFNHAIEWRDLDETARVKYGYKKNWIENEEQYINSLLP